MSEIGNDEDSEASDSLEYNRLNRWNGAYKTWQKYTEHERGLAASLDQIRNSDLSVHLYNAHALKKRAKEYEENPQTARVNKEHPAIPESDRIFKPPKYWTAWPLPPEDVPREDDKVGPNDSHESYTLTKKQIPWPSRELEDILMGVTLKGARSRFENRASESEDDASIQKENESENEITESERGDLSDDFGSEALDSHQNQSKEDNRLPNEQLKPALSLDDERSRELLRPSIRHNLSRLDDMLMALHHARMTCRRYSQSDAGTTDDENTTKNDDTITKARPKRPKGRPRKFANLPDRSRGKERFINPGKGDDEALRLKKAQPGRGRPRKVYEQLDGESPQDYMVRIARLQKKPLPSFAPSQSEATNLQSPSNARTSKSKSPRKRTNSEELRVSRQKKLGLRDWSEVLGAAALVGFSPNVIARATQRCANLFDEGMEMRDMIEMPFSEKESTSITRYVPEMIPDFDAIVTDDDSEASNISSAEADRKSKSRINRTTKTSGRMTFFCPILGCPRKVRGFRDSQSLRRHLQKGHKIGLNEIDEYILPSDEEMDGAVHVDGFLKPIRSHKQRQRSKDTRKRKVSPNMQTNTGLEQEQSSLDLSEDSDGWSPSE